MKKVLSIVLALLMIFSIGTVAVLAEPVLTGKIYIATHPKHVRKGNVVYYPHEFDSHTSNYFYELCNSFGIYEGEAKIRIKFVYNPESLELVDVLESRDLYDAGGTADIVEYYDVESPIWRMTKGFIVEVKFDIENAMDNKILFNLKFNVLEENFITEIDDNVYASGNGFNWLVDSERYCIDSENFKWLLCEITDSDGQVHDMSDYFSLYYNYYGLFYEEYEDLLINWYDPFEPPTGDVREVTYIQSEDTHKTFTARVNNRHQMIQFIEPDGGTRTYDRYNKNVKITSYNEAGEEVTDISRDLAYEIWEIYSNMSVGNDIKVRGKINGAWETGRCTFKVEPYNPVRSMSLAGTRGSTTQTVPAEIIADSKTEAVMLKMPNGTTVTVGASDLTEDGYNIFRPTVWINKIGTNRIQVYIRRDNRWIHAGELKFFLETDKQ